MFKRHYIYLVIIYFIFLESAKVDKISADPFGPGQTGHLPGKIEQISKIHVLYDNKV